MIDAAWWKAGLLRINAAFTLANAGYDSDVYFGYLEEQVPDYTLAAGVPVQVFLPINKKIVLDLSDNPQYVFYLDTERERGWNNVFQSRIHIAMERLYIRGGAEFSNIRQRLSPELNVNIRRKANRFEGLILWQASRVTSLAAVYGSTAYDFGDSQFDNIDLGERLTRREDFVDLITYFQPSPRIRFFLDGQYGTYTFEESAERNTQSYAVFGGFELFPREGELIPASRFQGRLRLGYLRFDARDPQLVDGEGLVGVVDLSLEIIRKTTIRGFFSREFQFSAYSEASFFASMNYGGGVTRMLSRRASISYNVAFGQSAYPEEAGGGGIPMVVRFRYTTHMGSLNLQLARNLTLAILGNLGRRVMSESGQARSRGFVGLNLTYGYPPADISTPVTGMGR